ncbi:probable G-protein coupled receptor 34 [Corythoichthys intestinalis]|uniref:probable G-protein coupled receptor 34 n=1 Tax=Corythoichthys intestinalis TaxID=161448 RepID=UPI0025A60F39|nr:probable G-protein coupled receptor 34 [Corythoichthys intestinalis]XP_061803593.1 probable G-protein coupled receptor 34 [Nerophis lumbriciformis]
MNISTASSLLPTLVNTDTISLFSLSVTSPTRPHMTSSSVTPKPSMCLLDDTALRLPLAFLYSLLFLLGLVGNLFALWVFLFVNASRNSVRMFLINCAIADLVLLACLPFRIFYHMNGNHWLLGHVACKLVGNLFYMNMYISITLLGFISLDRYLRLKGKGRVKRSLAVRLCGWSCPWSWVACGALWGLSLAALVPMIATAEDKEDKHKCFQFKHRQLAKGKAYFNVVLVALFWLVFLMLIVSYAKIAQRLIKVSRDKPDLPNAQRYERTAKKSFFVLFLFTLCFAPYHIFRPIYILAQLNPTAPCDYLRVVDYVNEIMLLFSAFNSCLDPIMYFLISGSVRKTARHALKNRLSNRLFVQNEVTSNSSTTEFRRSSVHVALTRTAD